MSDYAAVLWDLDGTIVDTEPLWIEAEHDLAARHGAVWTQEDALQLVGNSLIASGEYIRNRLDLPITAEQVVDHLVAHLVSCLQTEVPWRAGAVELITELADRGTPQALVTMSYAPIAAPIATVLPFQAVVTGDAVPRPKPHPDPYLLAAERLGVSASQCLAVEDSPTGAASANAAGCDVIVVPHMVPVAPNERRRMIPTLSGVDAAALLTAFR